VTGIPVLRDLAAALAHAGTTLDDFIVGIAPVAGLLSAAERALVLHAMELGMSIVNGLHEFQGDDPEFRTMSLKRNVKILDVRKPRAKKDPRIFTGRIDEVTCPRIAVLGTDCAIGKRTTATILTRALNARGVKAVLVGTGQTGLIQGARYGVALDAIPSQFCSGELEATIVEGQGALVIPPTRHRFLSSAAATHTASCCSTPQDAPIAATTNGCRCRHPPLRLILSRPSRTRRSLASRSITST
jgi:uncharacterized NAD-dependent epimerase/dehydratase family protein